MQETTDKPHEEGIFELSYATPRALRKKFGFSTLSLLLGLVGSTLTTLPFAESYLQLNTPDWLEQACEAVLLWAIFGGCIAGVVGFFLEEDCKATSLWGLFWSVLPIGIFIVTLAIAAASGEL